MSWLTKPWVKRICKDEEVLESYGRAKGLTLPFNEIEILSWNAYKGKGEGFSSDLTALASQCDIVCLQEAADNFRFEDAALNAGSFRWHLAKSFIGSKDVGTGVMTGSIACPTIIPEWIRSKGREPFIKTPKMSLVTIYEVGKGPTKSLMVINIHGLNFTSTSAFEDQILDCFGKAASHRGPVVFVGDFNTRNKARHTVLRDWAKTMKFSQIELKGARTYDQLLVRDCEVVHVNCIPVKSSNHPAIYFKVKV